MIHLRSAAVAAPDGRAADSFPFTIPAVADLAGRSLTFETPITFLVGENGSGKSTVLEALAAAIGSITAGSTAAASDRSLAHLTPLVEAIRLTWSKRTRRGFFLRSEDFFGYARRMHELRAEFEAERAAIWADPERSDTAKGFATMPYSRELADMERRYGAGLDAVPTARRSSRSSAIASCPRGCSCWMSRRRRCRRCASSPCSRS